MAVFVDDEDSFPPWPKWWSSESRKEESRTSSRSIGSVGARSGEVAMPEEGLRRDKDRRRVDGGSEEGRGSWMWRGNRC